MEIPTILSSLVSVLVCVLHLIICVVCILIGCVHLCVRVCYKMMLYKDNWLCLNTLSCIMLWSDTIYLFQSVK